VDRAHLDTHAAGSSREHPLENRARRRATHAEFFRSWCTSGDEVLAADNRARST